MTAKPTRKPSQVDFIKTALRLPPDLHARLHESTASSGRSLNSEIVDRLEASFRRSMDDSEISAATKKIESGFERMKKHEDHLRFDARVAKLGAVAASVAVLKLLEKMPPEVDLPEDLRHMKLVSRDLLMLYRDADLPDEAEIAEITARFDKQGDASVTTSSPASPTKRPKKAAGET